MSRKIVYPFLIVLVLSLLFYAEKYMDTDQQVIGNNETVTSNSEEIGKEYLPSSTTGAIVYHDHYSLSYSEDHEQAEWVAYELKKSDLSKNEFKRPYFYRDEKVSTQSADWRNYKKSGYDRGHLCPAGDRRFSKFAYDQTFLTSNVSPQNRGFNAGIWNRLEQKVRRWANELDGVYVVTGGVLEQGLKTIGSENVSVPNMFYKVVVDLSNDEPQAVAFLIPNKDTSDSYFNYVVSIDTIEERTGIDFFPNMDESAEKNMERSTSLKHWK